MEYECGSCIHYWFIAAYEVYSIYYAIFMQKAFAMKTSCNIILFN